MSLLQNRDYTLIIDKSGSMSTKDQKGNRSRWESAQESTQALAAKCEQYDPDGITVYLFSSKFKRYENVDSAKVDQLFQENEPAGSTDLAAVLQHATDSYFQRKAKGGRPETILVVTDGQPDDQRAVMRVIVEASRKLQRDEDLAISLIQVGKDPKATQFLKVLDDELTKAGAKFDICDTVTIEDMDDMPLSEVLLNAVKD